MKRERRKAWPLLVLSSIGCSADGFSTLPVLVTRPRVLTVIAEPPEARPGQVVNYRAVIAAPHEVESQDTKWSYCVTPRAPGQRSLVAEACRSEAGVRLANGLNVKGRLPIDACQRFGPDPLPTTNSAPVRPQDPDATGGYYVPLRLQAFNQLWFHFERTWCALPDVPNDLWTAFATSYTSNHNPQARGVQLGDQQTALDVSFAALPEVSVFADDSLTVVLHVSSASWEEYTVLDQARAQIVPRVEQLMVEGYVTGGELTPSAISLERAPQGGTVQFNWTAWEPGPASYWLIVRDDRRKRGLHRYVAR